MVSLKIYLVNIILSILVNNILLIYFYGNPIVKFNFKKRSFGFLKLFACLWGLVAQLVERCLCTADVSGSNPLRSTINLTMFYETVF